MAVSVTVGSFLHGNGYSVSVFEAKMTSASRKYSTSQYKTAHEKGNLYIHRSRF